MILSRCISDTTNTLMRSFFTSRRTLSVFITLHKELSSRTHDIRRKDNFSAYFVFRRDNFSFLILHKNTKKMLFSEIPKVLPFRNRKYPNSFSLRKSKKMLFSEYQKKTSFRLENTREIFPY